VLINQKSVKELGIHHGIHPVERQIKVIVHACCPENIIIVKANSEMIHLVLEIYAKFWSQLQSFAKSDRGSLPKGLEQCESNYDVSTMVGGVEVVPVHAIEAHRETIVIATLTLNLHAFIMVRGKCHISADLP
jgi:hypothetical protein